MRFRFGVGISFRFRIFFSVKILVLEMIFAKFCFVLSSSFLVSSFLPFILHGHFLCSTWSWQKSQARCHAAFSCSCQDCQ